MLKSDVSKVPSTGIIGKNAFLDWSMVNGRGRAKVTLHWLQLSMIDNLEDLIIIKIVEAGRGFRQ